MGIPAEQAAWAWIELGSFGRVCFLLASSPSVGRRVGQGRFVPGAEIHLEECFDSGKSAPGAEIHRERSELAWYPLATMAGLEKSASAAETQPGRSDPAYFLWVATMAELGKSAVVAETRLGHYEPA